MRYTVKRMAPPPFKVVGDLPRPLTVKETAKTLRMSPQKLRETLEAIRSISLALEKGQTREARRAPPKTLTSAKAAKSSKAVTKTVKAAPPRARQARKPAKAAARPSR